MPHAKPAGYPALGRSRLWSASSTGSLFTHSRRWWRGRSISCSALLLGIPVESTARRPAALWAGRAIDGLILAAVVGFAVYYWLSITRIEERIENVSPVFTQDMIFGILFVVLLLEGVRRTTGWILVWVILAFLAYGAFAVRPPDWRLPWISGLRNTSKFS